MGRFHMRVLFTAGMGFFTDAYDLFIIGVALALIKVEYHPSPFVIGLVGSTALIAALIGATGSAGSRTSSVARPSTGWRPPSWRSPPWAAPSRPTWSG